jgi:hypothetical protein
MITAVQRDRDDDWASQNANALRCSCSKISCGDVGDKLQCVCIDHASGPGARYAISTGETHLPSAGSVERFLAESHLISVGFKVVFMEEVKEK